MSGYFDIGIAAGMIKSDRDVNPAALQSIGTIRLGSFTWLGRTGNAEPSAWYDPETQTGYNAIGLKNPGFRSFIEKEAPLFRELLGASGTEADLSFAPTEAGELRQLCALASRHRGALPIRLVEVNAACPNHRKGKDLQPVLAHDPDAVDALLMELKDCPFPVSLKIAPNTLRETLYAIVNLCIKYGVTTIVSGNTLGSEATWNGKPVLSVARGGMSGKPLFEMAVAQVTTLKNLIREQGANIKVEGVGGIFVPSHVARMRQAGADSVAVASLFYWGGGWDAVADLSTQYNLL